MAKKQVRVKTTTAWAATDGIGQILWNGKRENPDDPDWEDDAFWVYANKDEELSKVIIRDSEDDAERESIRTWFFQSARHPSGCHIWLEVDRDGTPEGKCSCGLTNLIKRCKK